MLVFLGTHTKELRSKVKSEISACGLKSDHEPVRAVSVIRLIIPLLAVSLALV